MSQKFSTPFDINGAEVGRLQRSAAPLGLKTNTGPQITYDKSPGHSASSSLVSFFDTITRWATDGRRSHQLSIRWSSHWSLMYTVNQRWSRRDDSSRRGVTGPLHKSKQTARGGDRRTGGCCCRQTPSGNHAANCFVWGKIAACGGTAARCSTGMSIRRGLQTGNA